MIATEPLPEKVFDDIGLEHGMTFADYRSLVIYGQRTSDNRIAFGGRALRTTGVVASILAMTATHGFFEHWNQH